MYTVVLFCILSSLTICLVKGAPVPQGPNTSKDNKSQQDATTYAQREQSFEKFFAKLSEEMMEDTEKDIQEIIKAEDALYKDFADILGNAKNGDDAKDVTTEDSKDGKSRTRRSFAAISSGVNVMNAENVKDDVKSRKRRSYRRYDSMLRHSSRGSSFMKRSAQVICRRRCYWKRVFDYCNYGISSTEACIC